MTVSNRLAVVAPLTGPRSRWGKLFPASLLEHTSVEVFDDAADPERSSALAQRIAASGEFSAVVGHFSGEAANNALAAYRNSGTPVAFPLSSAPGVTREHLDPNPGIIAPMPDNEAQASALWQSCGSSQSGNSIAWAGASAGGLADGWSEMGGHLTTSVEEIFQWPDVTTLVVLGTLTDAEETFRLLAEDGRRAPNLRMVLSDDSWVGSPLWDDLTVVDRPEVVTSLPDPAVLVERCAEHMLEAVQQDLSGSEIVALWAKRYGPSVWGKPQPVGVKS